MIYQRLSSTLPASHVFRVAWYEEHCGKHDKYHT